MNTFDEKNLKPCPFCGGKNLYITEKEDYLGTKIPQIFCNWCKISIEPENDSPYINDEHTWDYLLRKVTDTWNRRVHKVPVRKVTK